LIINISRVFFLLLLINQPVQARNDLNTYSIQDAYDRLNIQSKLGAVKLYFDGMPHPPVQENIGSIQNNRKTNAFNKSDLYACQWVFFSALLSLKDRAIADGGDAVINIKSNYKNQEFSSSTEYQCGVGAIIAGVALVGDVVKLTNTHTVIQKQDPRTHKKKCSVKQIFEFKNSGMTDSQIEQKCRQSPKPSKYNTSLTKEVQSVLSTIGYNAGKADGIWGERSRSAMRKFQIEKDLEVTGEFNDRTLKELGLESEMSMSGSSSRQIQAKNKNSEIIPVPEGDLLDLKNTAPTYQTKSTGQTKSIVSTFRTRIKYTLYSEPDPFSEILLTIPKNIELDIISDNSEWLKVVYKGKTGFIVKKEIQ